MSVRLAPANLVDYEAMVLQTRDILNALRVAALWLLVVAVFAGPLGVGAFVASAATKTCGVSCPCDEEEHAEEDAHSNDDCDGSREVACGDETPCDEECPDDCPDCNCCPGLMIGLIPIVVPGLPGALSSSKFFVPPDARASGKIPDVFRPPRSLT